MIYDKTNGEEERAGGSLSSLSCLSNVEKWGFLDPDHMHVSIHMVIHVNRMEKQQEEDDMSWHGMACTAL
ncbi:hypothetical protein V6N13_010538 [Hibiscus sabdariffa]